MREHTLGRAARTAFWLTSPLTLWELVGEYAVKGDLGWDAHCYWTAWQGGLYDRPVGARDAYLYSPAFAQAIWPATLLPWPVFLAGWTLLLLLALIWAVWPIASPWRGVVFAAGLGLAISPGNIEILLAACAVLALAYPALWALPLLTKITPGVGVLWHAARGEWGQLAVAVGTTAGVVGLSYACAPSLWQGWIHFLMTSGDAPVSIPAPPLATRLAIAAGLVVWGGRTNRAWTLAAAMSIATPRWGPPTLLILLAIPRLRLIPELREHPTRIGRGSEGSWPKHVIVGGRSHSLAPVPHQRPESEARTSDAPHPRALEKPET